MEKSTAICFGSVLMLSAAVALYYLLYMPYNQSTQIQDTVEHDDVHFDEIIAADQELKAKCMDHNIIPSISKSLSMLLVQPAIAVVGMVAAAIVISKQPTISYHDGIYWSNGQHESPLNDDLQSSAGVSATAMEEQCNQEQTSELVIWVWHDFIDLKNSAT